MASKTEVTKIDDLDGSTEGVDTYHLGLAGNWYEIDLTEKNAAKLDKFFEVARPVDDDEIAATYKSRKRGTRNEIVHTKEEVAAAREWGRQNGFAVSKAGRLSRELWAAYAAA